MEITMKKWISWKRIAIAVGIIAILVGSISIYHTIERRGRDEIAKEEERIADAYTRVNVAFSMMNITGVERQSLIEIGVVTGIARTRTTGFVSRSKEGSRLNEFNIYAGIYLSLRFYENRTGIYLSYDKVIDYFSQKYESDGTLRLYNNGKHPEIEKYVDWFWNNLAEFDEFDRRVFQIYIDYVNENENFELKGVISNLSPQMLDALARAEADPDYVLDLTSLREQGY